jgi:ADP-ribose pyrophosphatase
VSENQRAEPGQISSEPVYMGRIVKLYKDTVRFPDGSTGQLDVVRHPGASAVVPFLTDPTGDDPQLLLIKQYRYAAGGFIYEIPAGMLDEGEDPLQCAHRELKEEVGCTAKNMEHLFTLLTTPGFTDERINIYMATGLERGDTAHESDEFLTIETMTLSFALGLIQKGEIQDGKTALGILFAAGFRSGL